MKGNDIIDSRELTEHYEDLQSDFIDSYNEWAEENDFETIEDWEEAENDLYEHDTTGIFSADFEELEELRDFIEELEGYGDFAHGETIINDDYWEEYVKELLEDCGTIPSDLPWYVIIDWTATANNIEQDYIQASWGNITYYMRA